MMKSSGKLRIIALLFLALTVAAPCSAAKPSLFPQRALRVEAQRMQSPELHALREWFSQDFSFTISALYMNLAYNGFSQSIRQDSAMDDSFHFVTVTHQWDHVAQYDVTETADFYYRREEDGLACYMRIDDGAPTRGVLSAADELDNNASKQQIVGPAALLPVYMKDFAVKEDGDQLLITFSLPFESVLSGSSLLSAFVSNMFSFSGTDKLPGSGTRILCTITALKDTFKPVSLSYDLSELAPYVLSSGAQSAEFAFGTEFITLDYTFSYELPSAVSLPAAFEMAGRP